MFSSSVAGGGGANMVSDPNLNLHTPILKKKGCDRKHKVKILELVVYLTLSRVGIGKSEANSKRKKK